MLPLTCGLMTPRKEERTMKTGVHPDLHRIVVDSLLGKVDALLYDDENPLVEWAGDTHLTLLNCGRSKVSGHK